MGTLGSKYERRPTVVLGLGERGECWTRSSSSSMSNTSIYINPTSPYEMLSSRESGKGRNRVAPRVQPCGCLSTGTGFLDP